MRPWFRRRLTAFRHVNGRGLSPIAHLPDPYLTRSSRAFPHTFSTTVFSQCTCGRFEAFPRRAAPEGQTTSIASTAPHSAEPPSTNPSCLLRSRSQHLSHSTASETASYISLLCVRDTRTSRFSRPEIPRMHRFFDPAGSTDGSRKRRRRCCLPPCRTASAPRTRRFTRLNSPACAYPYRRFTAALTNDGARLGVTASR